MISLRVDLLRVDPELQRPLDEGWVEKHRGEFDADKLGHPVVSLRQDGHHYVIDGQGRCALLRAVGWGDQHILCEVYEGLTTQQEAIIFLGRNDTRHVVTFDKFRLRIQAGDPVACDINRIVNASGMGIHKSAGSGRLSAVAALEKVYSLPGGEGASALMCVLRIIQAAWGRETKNFDGQVIQGLGAFLAKYGENVEEDSLVGVLAKFPGGASGLIGKAKSMHELRGGKVFLCVGGVIADAYNLRKGGRGKLGAWWS